jgi:N-methylhydantoinase B
LAGGKPGASSRNFVRASGENDFKVVDPVRLLSGPNTSVRVATAGGGGWGDPLERDPERVLADVRDEFVSVQSARDDYGVVIDMAGMTVDSHATATLRTKLRAATATKAKAG